ncbi:MAG: PAS domain S-box protein [Geobacteraceae bacterium]
MKGNLEKVLGLGLELKDIVGLSEKCLELTQGEAEISYCVITEPGGKPLYANDPRFLEMRFDTIVRSFVMAVGKRANLIETIPRYYDTAQPIYTVDGREIAQVHVGFKEKIVWDKVETKLLRSILILLIFFMVLFSVVVVFVRKSVIQPISALLSGVEKIAEGDFSARIEEVAVYEFNELAKNINITSESLKNRDEEIKRSYKELETTHADLHNSYIKLERLSLELESSEELYKSLMEDASDAIAVFDANGTIKMLNRRGEELFGYSAREIIGLPLAKLFLLMNIENISRMHEILKSALDGNDVSEEFKVVRKDGTKVTVKARANRVKSGGEQMMQAILQDVTREREIIQNLEQSAAELERLNKMKDSFLGLASHELKTPLTVIMGYAELIMTDMPEQLDKTTLEMVENIANAASRLDNIVKDMLDVSMIDDRRLQLNREKVNLNRLVETSINELRFFLTMRNQELVMQFDETIPLINGDPSRLLQLLTNVLGNAIKFTPDGGSITVTTNAKYLSRSRPVVLPDQTKPSANAGKESRLYAEVIITDTGIGIARDDQLRIFDKFFEVGNIEEHSTGKVAFKAKGAGLGLAIAKGIVEMHGGDIWVESSGYDPLLYPGSTFHILLPVNPLISDVVPHYMNILE